MSQPTTTSHSAIDSTTTPDSMASDSLTPDSTTPDPTTPDSMTPDVTKPDSITMNFRITTLHQTTSHLTTTSPITASSHQTIVSDEGKSSITGINLFIYILLSISLMVNAVVIGFYIRKRAINHIIEIPRLPEREQIQLIEQTQRARIYVPHERIPLQSTDERIYTSISSLFSDDGMDTYINDTNL